MAPAPEPSAGPAAAAYLERRVAREVDIPVRGLSLHLRVWGQAAPDPARRPTLLLLHGWMDVAASFQFMVDALTEERHVIALDWRGFGLQRCIGCRQLLVSRLPGRSRPVARRARRPRRGRRGDRSARSQHGRQRGDAVRRHPAATHPAAGQPGGFRHAGHRAGAGAAALCALAGRAPEPAAAAPLRVARRGRGAPAQDQSTARTAAGPVAGAALGAPDR